MLSTEEEGKGQRFRERGVRSHGKLSVVWLAVLLFLSISLTAHAQTIGYKVPPGNTSYTNSSSVSASKTRGNDISIEEVWGIYSDHDMESLRNTNTGSVNATGQAGSAVSTSEKVRSIAGIYINGSCTSFTNGGTISVSSAAGNIEGSDLYVAQYDIWGVLIDPGYTGKFTNSGDILLSVKAGSPYIERSSIRQGAGFFDGIYAVPLAGVGMFKNEGRIRETVEAGNAAMGRTEILQEYIAGLQLGYSGGTGRFYNTGEVEVDTIAGSAVGNSERVVLVNGVYSAFFKGDVDSFANSGVLSTSTVIGDAGGNLHIDGDYYNGGIRTEADNVFGVYFKDGMVGAFTNSGTIAVSVQAGGASGNIDVGGDNVISWIDTQVFGVAGAYFMSALETLTNSGTIAVSASVGDANGDINISGGNSSGTVFVGANEIYGAYFKEAVKTLTNSGTVAVTVRAGSASGNNPTVEVGIGGIAGICTDNAVETLTNSGTVTVSASVGDALGSGAQTLAYFVHGINLKEGANRLDNTGNIRVTVKGGKNSKIDTVVGIGLNNGSGTVLSNVGNIRVLLSGKYSEVKNVAGIHVAGSSDVTISSPGTVWVGLTGSGNVNGVRTLWIENSSVTLGGSFSIVFGAPGVDPSTGAAVNVNRRPIYVDPGSTLDLNSVSLIARVDSRNLKFKVPYHLIQGDGVVNGEFGKLVGGWANPELRATWVGGDRSKDAALEFSYSPGSRSRTVAMGQTASYLIALNLARTLSGLPIPGSFHPRRQVRLTSLSTTLPSGNTRNWSLFVEPFYTGIDAEGLDFDADARGLTLGIRGQLTESLYMGFFGGYGSVDLDFKTKGLEDENQDLYFGGLSVLYTPKRLFTRLSLYFHTANHRYRGWTGANYDLREKANYDSWGLGVELTAGHTFGNGRFFLTPEVGLAYTHYKADSFHTEVSTSPTWNRHYDPNSVSFPKGILSLYGFARLRGRESRATLYGLVRLEQSFGDGDVSLTSCLDGLPSCKLHKDISSTTLVGQLGFSLKVAGRCILEIGGQGDLNADYSSYTGRAALRFLF